MAILRSMHWTHGRPAGTVRVRRCAMLDNSVLAGEILRHGAYVCVRLADGADPRGVAGAAIPALAEKLGLVNEFEPAGGPPALAIAYLRRHGAAAGAVADDGVAQANAVVHVAAPTAQLVSDFCAEATRLLGSMARLRVIGGVVRPRTYTGAAMKDRKSTRLNSSHVSISYAVFCLKKKKNKLETPRPPTTTNATFKTAATTPAPSARLPPAPPIAAAYAPQPPPTHHQPTHKTTSH